MTVGTTTHVSLAGHEYIVRPGSYAKRQAPQFGARFTTGDPDLNNLSFWQHWSQRCFVGGVDQDLFADDAMYDEGVGIDSTQHAQMTLGRGLAPGAGANWAISSGAQASGGNITGVATTDVLTAASAHGFVANDQVTFTSITGGAGLVVGTAYYVIAAGLTATNFEVSAAPGGAAVDFTTDVTAGAIGKTGVSGGGFQAVIYNSILYVLTVSDVNVIGHLWKYDPATDGWTRVTSLDTADMTLTCIGTFDGKLWVGGCSRTTTTGKLVYSSGTLATWNLMANPSGLDALSTITAMRTFQERLYVSYSAQIWRVKNDITWDGNTVFYKVNMNSQSNGIVSMETHLGFLYMLSLNGHIHRTDGNSTFDIWSWDGQTEGVSIKSFDGRLFVLTFEYTNTADVGAGVLYQMSGSAVTQLKRWGDEADATRIGSMTVYDRRMFYGASNLLGFGARTGFGVACYDAIEDSHSIVASNSDTTTYPTGAAPYRNYIVDDQIFFEGRLYVFVRGFGALMTPYRSRDAVTGVRRYDVSAAGGAVAALNGGWFTTSTYDAGTPGLRKLWRRITLDTTVVTGTAVIVEYSTNDGGSWTALTAITAVAARQRTDYWLNNVSSTSIKLRVTLRSTNVAVAPVFYGFMVAYVPQPEPNWMWSFAIVLATKIQAADQSVDLTYDTETELAFLATQHRAHNLVAFTDIDGVQWASGGLPGVLIYDIEFRIRDLTQPLEGEVLVTLLEAVEAY